MFNMAPQVRPSILLRADFPIYAIKALDSSRFLIAGGGGQSKTGVPNAFVIFIIDFVFSVFFFLHIPLSAMF